jgi:hypothetical protein
MHYQDGSRACFVALGVALLLGSLGAAGMCQDRQPAAARLTDRLHHLRIGDQREWSEFPEKPEAEFLELKFAARNSAGEQTIVLRQQDVKQSWQVRLNGKEIAGCRSMKTTWSSALPSRPERWWTARTCCGSRRGASSRTTSA